MGLGCEEGKAKALAYNYKKNFIDERAGRDIDHDEVDPWRLLRLGERLFYTGENGTLSELEIDF